MKSLIKKTIAVLLLTGAIWSHVSAETTFKFSDNSPFAFNWVADSVIVTAGTGLSVTSLYLEYKNIPQWDGVRPDLSKVNSFDRWAAQPYSKPWHIAGTAAAGAELLLTPALIAGEAFFGSLPKQEIFSSAAIYVESFLLAYGTKNMLKQCVNRYRPYMYFDGYPQDKVDEGDFLCSWPSGHTTDAFLGASLTCSMMNYYFAESRWRVPVNVCAFTLAAATGAMRLMSGNHFITDVLTGAAIGTFYGFAVPFIHHKLADALESESNGKIKNVAVNLLPMGMYVSCCF